MIPRIDILNWYEKAPWALDAQVEQDLVLSRALIELYSNPVIQNTLAFRGGTALQKLFFNKQMRYSEDLDFVQVKSGGIGEILDALRDTLDPWLGKPKRKQNFGRVTLLYKFITEIEPISTMRVKIEINTREHFSLFGLIEKDYSVKSKWFSGSAKINTYTLEEMLGTKLRALYQRRKGRDLFDLINALLHLAPDPNKIIYAFSSYMDFLGAKVSRAEFEENFYRKLEDDAFVKDMVALLPREHQGQLDYKVYGKLISEILIIKLAGGPWKGILEAQKELELV